MPGWKYDSRLGTMVPKTKKGLEFSKVVGGLKVIDNDLRTSFIILRSNDEIGYMQGVVATRGVKIYDHNKAMRIAEMVKRVMPTSKYTDFRKFCKGVSENVMSDDDYALLEKLVNGYKNNSLNEAVNEVSYSMSVENPQHSDMKSIGATEYKGVNGLIKSLPSALIAFAFCPPLAIIKLFGAIRTRTEKRWLKTMFNTNTWADFVAVPSEKKEALKKKMRDDLAKKTQYYYSELANGEIIKVPACSTIEARDMILAIERKEIEERYKKYNSGYCHVEQGAAERGIFINDSDDPTFYSNLCIGDPDNECKMWCIKFSDGQASYAFGPEGQRDQIMKDAVKSKEAITECYKRVVLKAHEGDDNAKDKIMKHLGIGKTPKGDIEGLEYVDELFATPTVDDMIEIKNISMYSPITEANEKDFSDPVTTPIQWKSKQYPQYYLPIGETGDKNNPYMIEFRLPASKDNEVSIILKSVLNGLSDYIQKENNTFKALKMDKSLEYVTVKYDINNTMFNIICIDNKIIEANGNVKIDNNIASKYSNCLVYSDIKGIIRTIEECFRNAYSDSNLEKGLRNEYNSNYSKTAVSKSELNKNITTINWEDCWNKVLNELKIGQIIKGQLVKTNGNENIRQEVEIKLAA